MVETLENRDPSSIKVDEMTAGEQYQWARHISSLDDLMERARLTDNFMSNWYRSPLRDFKYKELDLNIDYGKLESLRDDVFDAWAVRAKEKGKNLQYSVAEDFLKELADIMIPTYEVGVEGNQERNFHTLLTYLQQGSDKKNNAEQNVRQLIMSGDVMGAVEEVKKTLKGVFLNHDTQTTLQAVNPPGDYKERDFMSKNYLSPLINEEFHRRGLDRYIPEGFVTGNMDDIWMQRGQGKYEAAEQYSEKLGRGEAHPGESSGVQSGASYKN